MPSVNAAGEPLSQLVVSQVNGLRSRARELRAAGNAAEAIRVESQANRVLSRAAAVGKPLEASRSRHHRAAKLGQLKKLKRDMGDAVRHPELPAEMQRHAWRAARLLRMRKLLEASAMGEQQAALVARVRRATARELDRHRSQLKRLAADAPTQPASPTQPVAE